MMGSDHLADTSRPNLAAWESPLGKCLERSLSVLPSTNPVVVCAGRLRVCYVGGSITEQKAGWRPRTHEWLNTRFPCDFWATPRCLRPWAMWAPR
jgi:hypothetical protein